MAGPPPEYDYERGLVSNRSRQSSGSGVLAKIFMFLFVCALGGGTFFAVKYYHLKGKGSDASESGSGSGDGPNPSNTPDPSSGPSSAAWKALAADIEANLNRTADPCDDFYEFACGGWIKANPLSADQTRNSRAFVAIADANQAVLRSIAEEDWPVIGPMYQSCMDTDALDAGAGRGSVDGLVALATGAGKDKKDVFSASGKLWGAGVQPLCMNAVAADATKPTVNRWNFAQGGLTLPDMTGYFKADVVKAYNEHVAKMFALYYGGEPAAMTARARAVVNFETAIAEVTKPAAEMRDPHAVNNVMTVTALAGLAPSVDWFGMLAVAGVDTKAGNLLVNIDNPSFFSGLSAAVGATGADVLSDYLAWKVIHTYAGMLSKPFREESFAFFSGVLQGVEVAPPRWTTCVSVLTANFGDITGRHFVQRSFSPRARNITAELIDNVKASYEKLIPTLSWMDEDTKKGALAKFQHMLDKVGYPETWDDYAGISISADTLVDNTQTMTAYRMANQIASLDKKPDRMAWQMYPSMVNAYYAPDQNDINFPAGILQPSFFSENYPDAANYGGIGMVAGHEAGHSVDDQGSQYDYTGALRNWWSNASLAHFDERTSCYVEQYSKFVIDGMHVNGSLTLGENLADCNGIVNAHRAYEINVAKVGAQPPISADISNDKLFFLNFAQNWCMNVRPKYQQYLLQNDPHSPAKFRVNGPLANYPKFAEVFQCAAGTPMNPAKRCETFVPGA